MPKMKSHRGAAKRFKFSGKGKVRFKHANLRHCLEHKDKRSKKKLSQAGSLKDCDAKRVRQLLPYDA